MQLLDYLVKVTVIVIAAFSVGCSIQHFSKTKQVSADLILFDGKVYTVDANRSWAEAVAVIDGKIAYVGSSSGAKKYKGPNTRLVDLDGKMVLPGFQDAHVHPIEAGMAYLGCSLHDGKSVEDYVLIVKECAQQSPEATFIDGGGWTMDLFEDGLPDKRLLDEVVSDRPVILKSASGHQLWVNSKTLKIAGIDAETPDPPRGRIDRYKNSKEPSGSLQENSAMNLAFSTRPAYSADQMQAALQFGQHYLNQYGVTTLQDALLKLDGNEAYVGGPTYMAMDRAGDLTIRVVGALVWNTDSGLEQLSRITDARERFKTPLFSAPSVKIWLDGVMEVHTAALLAPYSDREDGYSGELLIKPEQLDVVVSQLDALGFQIHFHAIGDAAVRQSLDSLELARQKNGVRDSRHHMSHIQLFDPADIPRLETLNVVANFQPYWAWADKFITELTIPKLGADRSKWLYPIRSVLDTGAVVAFGSDWFVTSGNPLLGIETAITRRDPLTNFSDPFLEDERINLADAIEAYTINSAYVNFIDDETGSIEEGKLADLIVLDNNLFELAPNEISDAQVLLTLLEGNPVYGDWTLSSIPKIAQ
ncbi:amidohydrolase [Porticoccaceae bacterium]|nr:amidohydrolase [Porticoccaceae bacterium]MDA8878324.1 amidohydrolase [Porticoccaceae bacterium]